MIYREQFPVFLPGQFVAAATFPPLNVASRQLALNLQVEQLLQSSHIMDPVRSDKESADHGTQRQKSMSNPPKTILLVDDECSVREVMKMALEDWGYGVWVAEDGEEALSITRMKKPNLVLSDVIMPKLDGLALLLRLKRWNPKIAVILFTAHPSLADTVWAMKEGAADVLTKPIDFNRLRIELEGILGECGSSESRIQNPQAGMEFWNPHSGC